MSITDKFTFDAVTPHGRATLTICVDIRSRMVVGHSISIDSPSMHAALLALKGVNEAPAAPRDDADPQPAR